MRALLCRDWIAALLVMLGLATSQPAMAGECGSWNNNSEIRCLSKGEIVFSGEAMRIANISSQPMSFSVQLWFSRCGIASGLLPSPVKTVTLAPGQATDFNLIDYPMAKPSDPQAYCTEAFIFGCGSVPCNDLFLSARLSPADKAAKRDCKMTGVAPFQELRCLSEKDAAEQGETVVITNVAANAVIYRFQEWHSQCGLPGQTFGHSGQEKLEAGQSRTLKLFPNTEVGKFAWDLARCTELYITECDQADGKSEMGDSCANLVRATIAE